MAEPMLAVDGLGVRYGAVSAVRELTFEVAKGEIVGLVGPNGAGKTTTLLAVMGAVPRAAGDVRLAGRSLRRLPTEQIVRAGVSLVPEGRHVFGGLTVAENLRLGLVGRRERNGSEEDLRWVAELFPLLGEPEVLRRPAGTLSGGQQQQLAIARSLVARPSLLLLDEPSLGLAPAVVNTVLRALEEIRARGVTILLVEQRAQLTVGFADRTYVLANGSLRVTLTPADADDTEKLTAAYFG